MKRIDICIKHTAFQKQQKNCCVKISTVFPHLKTRNFHSWKHDTYTILANVNPHLLSIFY